MVTNNRLEVEGIVIGSADYKESSKILNVFTEDKGIISMMARGAKRPSSQMQNMTSLYALSKFDLNQMQDFYFLNDGHLIDLHQSIRTDIKKIYAAQLCASFIDRTLLEGQTNAQAYLLYKKSLTYLEKTDQIIRLVSMFILKYMAMIGYRPSLDRCVICNKTVFDQPAFSTDYGGLSCLHHQINYDRLDKQDLNYLKWLFYSRLDDIETMPLAVDEEKIAKLIIEFALSKTEITFLPALKAYEQLVFIK